MEYIKEMHWGYYTSLRSVPALWGRKIGAIMSGLAVHQPRGVGKRVGGIMSRKARHHPHRDGEKVSRDYYVRLSHISPIGSECMSRAIMRLE